MSGEHRDSHRKVKHDDVKHDKDEEKKDKDKHKRRDSQGVASGKEVAKEVAKAVGPPPSLTDDLPPLKDELLRLWNRPFLDTSTAKDIGRLAKGIEIIDERTGYQILYRAPEDISRPARVVLPILTTIAKAVGDERLAEAFEKHYWDLVQDKDAGDLSGQLSTLFFPAEKNGVLAALLPESSPFLRILKCINQEVMAPPVLRMKLEVHRLLQYRDVRGQWTVAIRFKANDFITVTHLKREQSHDQSPENQFEFAWCFEMRFKSDSSNFSCAFKIQDYVFNEKTSRQKQNDVKKILDPFVVPDLPFRHCISRPQPNLAQELLRFAKVLEMNDEKKKLYSYNPADAASNQVGHLITVLAEHIEPALVPAIAEAYKKVKDSDSVAPFLTHGPIAESSKLMRVLKCISQEVAYPAIMKMRTDMHEHIPYKDVKGTWAVQIFLTPAFVTVTHRKKEQAVSAAPEDFFEFEWELSLMYDTGSVSELDVKYHITSYSFGEKTPTALKKKVLEVTKAHQAPGCQEVGNVAVSISELLNGCISGLAYLTELPVATLPFVQHPVPVIELLKRLDRTLTQLPQQLPPINVAVRLDPLTASGSGGSMRKS